MDASCGRLEARDGQSACEHNAVVVVSRDGPLHASEEGLLRVQLKAFEEAWRGREGGLQVGDELAQRMRCVVIRRHWRRLDSACHRAQPRLLARDAIHQSIRIAQARSRGLHGEPRTADRETAHDGQEHARERAGAGRERWNRVGQQDAQRAPTARASIAVRAENAPSATLHLTRRLGVSAKPSVAVERPKQSAVRACAKLDRVERAIDVADKSRRTSLTARRHLEGRYERDVEGGKRAECRRFTRPRSGCLCGTDSDGECGGGGVVRVMEGRSATVTGRFDLVRVHPFLVVAPAPHCRAHVAERVRGRRSRTTAMRLAERPRRALSTAKGVACVRPKWSPVVIEQSYCNQSAMRLSDACGAAHKSPSQLDAARASLR